MNKIHSLSIVLVGLLGLTFGGTTPKLLDLGAGIPLADSKMKDISGKEVTLNSSKGEEGLLVVFSCNTCPWVKAWQDRYPGIAQKASNAKVGMIVLNSNEATRGDGESLADMKSHAQASGYMDKSGAPLFPYVLDKDHKLADAFGATRTPELFLFDKAGKLVYRGAIDDNAKKPAEVKETYILDALANLAAGKEIATKDTKSIGCSIKRM